LNGFSAVFLQHKDNCNVLRVAEYDIVSSQAMISDIRIKLVTDLRNARLRVDRAVSDADREDALGHYLHALHMLRRHASATGIGEDPGDSNDSNGCLTVFSLFNS
jgi:hypothetical protein